MELQTNIEQHSFPRACYPNPEPPLLISSCIGPQLFVSFTSFHLAPPLHLTLPACRTNLRLGPPPSYSFTGRLHLPPGGALTISFSCPTPHPPLQPCLPPQRDVTPLRRRATHALPSPDGRPVPTPEHSHPLLLP
jgi:hypothetical protein